MSRLASAVAALLLTTSVLAGGAVAAQSGNGTFVYEGDQPVLHNGPGQSITGQTDLPEGAVVRMEISSRSAESPFLTRPEAVVGPNGTFTANFSLANLDAGTPIELIAEGPDGETIARTTAEVRPCNGQCPETTVRSGPSDDAFEVTDVEDDALLERDVVETRQGEIARIPVVLDGADDVTLVVGSERDGYRINASVSDGDGDGRVVVLFNTTAAAHPGTTLAGEDDADSLTVTDDETVLPSFIDSGAYDLRAYRGAPDGEPDAVGTLAVRDGDVEERDWPTPEPSDEFGIAGNVFTVYRGEVGTVDLTTGGETTATVLLYAEDVGYRANATVRDDDGDGRIGIVLDTAVGTTDAPIRVGDGDEVLRVNQTGNVSGTLPEGMYAVSITSGTNGSGERGVVGTLVVRAIPERSDPTRTATTDETERTGNGTTSDDAVETAETSSGPPVTDPAVVGGGAIGLVAMVGVGLRFLG